jgi:hypothetical protein
MRRRDVRLRLRPAVTFPVIGIFDAAAIVNIAD